ncbi:MAG TPA: translocation/assembly module TamB domain-containing protein [Bryobacteraceae bacterium]|nr:translocation/assembly module TamB domain-containing protein [Bryobacteraceae bacterium]
MSRRKKTVLYTLLGVIGLALATFFVALFLVQTDWFKNKVRAKIIDAAETASGGRVEIGSFNYNWHNLTAEVAPFVIHGKEPPNAPPFLRADKIQIGLKIISVMKKQFDVASLTVEKPQLYIVVAPDGTTNVPTPKVPSQTKENFAEQLLDLKVQHFDVHDGFARYNDQQIPLDLHCEHLRASLIYESAGPRYTGELSSHQVHTSSPQWKGPLAFDFDAKAALEQNRIVVQQAKLTNADSEVEINGVVNNLSQPHAGFNVTARAAVKELNKTFGLGLESHGTLAFQGKADADFSPFQYTLAGELKGSGLGYAYREVAIRNVGLSSRLEMDAKKINFPDLQISALHGHFRGAAELLDFKKLNVHGTAKGFSLREVAKLGSRETGELNGTLDGSISLEGVFARAGLAGVIAQAKMDITPGTGGVPVQGAVQIRYDQRAGTVQLGNSEVNLGSTHIGASGTLGQTMQVQVLSKNLNDFLPLFPIFGEEPPKQLPVALHGGVARLDGTVTGPLANPRVSGKADVTQFALDKRDFDHFVTTFDIDKSSADLHTLTLDQGKMRVEGQGRIGLQDWKLEDSSTISALLSVQGADIQKLLVEAGSTDKAPVSGTMSATLHVSGTFESPLVNGNVDLQNVTAYDQYFDRVRADVTATGTALEVANGDLRSGNTRIAVSGAYNHPANDWKDGAVRFDVSSSKVNLAQIKQVQDFRKGLGGELDLKATGTAKVVKGEFSLASLNGHFSLKNAVLDGRPYGNLELTAATRLPMLTLDAKVDLKGIQITGSGEWRMDGDYPGQARIQIPRVTFATLHDLWPGDLQRKDLPFEGFIQGEATITGALNKPSDMKGVVTLSTVQVSAGPNVHPSAGTGAQDLVLKNSQPVRFEGTLKSIDIRSADFVAKDTTLSATGRLALDSKNPWDLAVKGRINLTILQIFNPDLIASGVSVINMGVRGALTEPQVDGRLELQNASLFLPDLPNGVDQANGVILFDRNRATVQTLTAVTGGGQVTFESGGFVGFRGQALVYNLRATARQVRYRSPDGVSVTVNARLNLIGTSDKSVLSGNVIVERATFNPRTDVGTLLASTAKPVSVATTPNEYLRGLQFDISVISSRHLEVETSLTRNISADANLHVRGSPERPVVLGNISVSSGLIEFFGNKYTISRGEVNFYNPSKVDPIIDMDLETQVRGVVVDISFSGSLNKLNFSYRSDPPLQTNEIIALLAVGRAPQTVGGLASSQTTGSSNYLATGSNALLGQAIAPASGRLQRFFGVSHIKIDPQLTDITSVPQARLTLEQQVSTDITLTYITNLARTDQQIVRVEWDFSKKWSVVALRDENGAFGIDFQYRKRFK